MPQPATDDPVLRYSGICHNDESGDLNGFRLLLISGDPWATGRFLNRYYVVYQGVGGDLEQPVIGTGTIKAGTIEFESERKGGGPLVFAGKITPQLITGTFVSEGWTELDGKKIVFRLDRVSDSGEKGFPNCR